MKKLLVVLLVLGLAAPAMAAEWNWSGMAWINWTYGTFSEEVTGTGTDDTNMKFGTSDAGTTRIRARIKTSDTISAFTEIGYNPGRTGHDEGIKFRQLFGRWNFGAGNIVAGHTTTPAFSVIATPIGDDDAPFLKDGQFYTGRYDQIKFEFGGLVFAFINPDTRNGVQDLPGTYNDTDELIPKIEVAYTWKTKSLFIRPFVGYQTYDIEDNAADTSESVAAYVAGAYVKWNFGAGWVGGDLYLGQNMSNYHVLQRNSTGAPFPAAASAHYTNGTIEDSTGYGGFLAAGFKFSDRWGLQAGLGYLANEVDTDLGTLEDDSTAWYLQVPITLAKGVMLPIEVGQILNGDLTLDGVDTEQGDITYFGARLQIHF